MRKVQKVLALTGCAALLVVGSVAGTLAYLTSQDQVKNTFTVGKVKIHLDEYDYDNSNDQCHEGLCGVNRDEQNKYHLLPGITYEKDPMVTVSDRKWKKSIQKEKVSIPKRAPTIYSLSINL